MGIFDEIMDLAKDNPSETQAVVNQAEQFADQQTGGQYDSEIQQAVNFGEEQAGFDSNGGN